MKYHKGSINSIGFYLIKKIRPEINKGDFKLELESHPEYPTLSSLSDTYFQFGITNIVVQLSYDQLLEIPTPAIAHVKKNNSEYFVYIDSIEGNKISYRKGLFKYKTYKEDLSLFVKNWTGNVLLVDEIAHNDRVPFEGERKGKISVELRSVVLLFALFLTFLVKYWLEMKNVLPILFLKSIGIGLSVLLVKKELDSSGDQINNICKVIKNGDCDSVLRSSTSKIFNLVKLSELGVWYFFGGTLSVIFGVLFGGINDILPFLYLLSLGGGIFSVYSIFLQWKIIGKWCIFCLAVQLIFWIEITYLSIRKVDFFLNSSGLLIFLNSFVLAIILWPLIRNVIYSKDRIAGLQRKIKIWEKNKSVFLFFIQKSPPINVSSLPCPITIGNRESGVKDKIIIVSNLFCPKCGHVHKLAHQVWEKHKDIIIEFRFVLSTNDSRSEKVAKILFSIYENEGKKEALTALNHWYLIMNEEKWKKTYNSYSANDSYSAKVEVAYKSHLDWVKMQKIDYTPTIILNEKKVPSIYTLDSIIFFKPYFSKIFTRIS
jgi:uncharacterized membrane protein